MQPIKIRKFTNDDADEVASMHARTITQINSRDYPEVVIKAWVAKATPERHLLRPVQEEKLVAVCEGRIVGFSDYNKNGELEGLYVNADYQGRGVGEMLLVAIESDARSKGYKSFDLTSTITARPFYERHGFVVIEETFHEMGEEKLRVFKMKKELV